ncbi:integrase arm-type DNA-binding domain-containing protein [Acidovorax sp. SUPP950]|uniref:tyrosine-type recombinase/integrase n=1 Tax=Acidovorax sp. SUPP950 TaxID=511901 RepID=UPI0023CC19A2|nr:integrase arm-type DNA-binding domain-containing protein [Acidovorax sp. SUPP950]GKS77351.1 integrase arm-type DNA-binding domain-containing protein [Acidovorax sp. SUPP950]
MGQLNELQIKAATPRDKEYLLADGEGLYLRVRPTGKVWVYRYKLLGKEAKLSLGHYPVVTLAAARKKARAEAEKRADGVDPREARRVDEERGRVARLNTFELTARAWHTQARKDREWSASYAEKVMRHLELHVFPWLGALAMDTIAPTEVVRCLHRIKERGNLETAQRVREAVQHVFQYAVDVGTLEPGKNFVSSRTGGLPPPRARHYAAITDPQKLGQLLRDMRAYNGNVITRAALQLSPLLFQRPGQLRLAHWEDVDLNQALWRCPPEKMKLREWKKRDMRTPAHLVPLPTQAVTILRDIFPLTGPTGPIFRSMAKRSEKTRYMSDNTVNSALRTLGYDTKEQITGHGFRATARTLIRELLGWDREIIERHLAHVSDEELGGSYDRTTHLDQRCRMIQLWADLLDDLAAGKVVASANDMRSSTTPVQSWPAGSPTAAGVGNEDGFRVAA